MRTEIIILAVTLVFGLGCNRNRSISEQIEVSKIDNISKMFSFQDIDINHSIVKWKGTKLVGFSHEGTVSFKSGKLGIINGKLVSGEFTVDMTSIYNTDIPLSDPIPRKNITEHLNSDFETSIFPEAKFVFNETEYLENDKIRIKGYMLIRDIKRRISIEATEEKKQERWRSDFIINRFDYDIGKEGSWLERKLVNEEIALEVIIQVKKDSN